MNLRLVVISAACLAIFVVPASCTSLLAAAAAAKGVVLGAGLAALKTSGGTETVIIHSEPGSVAEVVPANQVQDNVHNPVSVNTAQTITYATSTPLSRLWETVANAISAKIKAISEVFRPNRIVVVVPHSKTTTSSTTTTTTQKPLITIDLEHKPLPGIGIEVDKKPLTLPGIDFNVDPKHFVLPSFEVSAVGPTFRRHPVAVINYLKK